MKFNHANGWSGHYISHANKIVRLFYSDFSKRKKNVGFGCEQIDCRWLLLMVTFNHNSSDKYDVPIGFDSVLQLATNIENNENQLRTFNDKT